MTGKLDSQIAIRLPEAILKRADRLVSRLADDPTVSAFGEVNRSDVLRLALREGLEVLEGRYGARKKKAG